MVFAFPHFLDQLYAFFNCLCPVLRFQVIHEVVFEFDNLVELGLAIEFLTVERINGEVVRIELFFSFFLDLVCPGSH